MKVAVVCQGAFNLFEVAVKNQKMHLYDVLDRNNIDYDIYINFSPDFYLKHPSSGVVLQTIDYVRDQCQGTQLLHDYRSNFNDPALVTKQPDGWYALDFGVSAEHINKVIRTSGIQDKIVRLNISEYISWADHIRQADNNNHRNYFTTAAYRGLKETRDHIKRANIKYDYFITLRPELIFDGRFNIMDFLHSNDFVTHGHGRLDFIQLSRTFLPAVTRSGALRAAFADLEAIGREYKCWKCEGSWGGSALGALLKELNGNVERMGSEFRCSRCGAGANFERLFRCVISKLVGLNQREIRTCDKIECQVITSNGAVLKDDGIFEKAFAEFTGEI